MNPDLEQWLQQKRLDTGLRDWAGDLLMALCEVDTSLGSDLDRLRANEQACFQTLTEAMTPFLGADSEARPLDVPRRIEDDPYFTKPYYAGPSADDVDAVYRGRFNWLIDPAPSANGDHWLLNAHVDTVPPHIPPQRINDHRIAGRGSADDKNGLVAMALVQRLLQEWQQSTGESPEWPVRYLISIDEEMGGNGTLGAVTHLDLTQSHIVVAEPSSLLPYPANRGAVWFAASLSVTDEARRADLYGLYAVVADALMAEGRRIREESSHPMFNAPKDAQTCFGILGPFGAHPSSACDDVELRWPLDGEPKESVLEQARSVIANALTAAIDGARLVHATKDPEVTLSGSEEQPEIHVRITARGGHMGSHERDSDALAKAAELILAMKREGFGCPTWPGAQTAFTLEGGQGFLPDRPLENLQQRMSRAFDEGVDKACREFGIERALIEASITFDKLHNAAFCSATDAPGGESLGRAIAALEESGMPELRGWKASCDARIFARQCPDVTTFGPGALEVAHSADEAIELQDILDMAAYFVHAVLQKDRRLS